VSRFLTPLAAKRPKNAIKKNERKKRGRRKKNGRKKATYFVMSPDGFPRVFELPCYETPKNAVK
jgi:hypothetical protein